MLSTARRSGDRSLLIMLSLIPGFLAGLLHVVSGPDHLAAVAPLVVKDRRVAWAAGLRWGMGHASGVAIIAVAALLLRNVLPVEHISSWSERLVGVLLIVLGVWSFRGALKNHMHTHEHLHDGVRHIHIHTHTAGHAPARVGRHLHRHTAFGIGTLHGLAGGSHFLALVPALALPTRGEMLAYIAAYGVGTISAMAGFSTFLGWLTHRFDLAGNRAYRGLMFTCSLAAVGVGVFWLTAGGE